MTATTTTTTTTTEMSNQDLLWRLQQLKSFKRARHKVHFLCKCDDTCIFVLSELMKNFLEKKFKIRNKKRIIKKLLPLRFSLRKLADETVSCKEKRQILIDIGVRVIIYPILRKILIPMVLKLEKKKK